MKDKECSYKNLCASQSEELDPELPLSLAKAAPKF